MNDSFRGIPLDNVTIEGDYKLYVTLTALVIEVGAEWWTYPFPLAEVMKSLIGLEPRASIRIKYTRNPGEADWSVRVEVPAYDRKHAVEFTAYRPSLLSHLMHAQSVLLGQSGT